MLFQSTPSARRATHNSFAEKIPVIISIHALREESDGLFSPKLKLFIKFQSTPSARRATDIDTGKVHQGAISIHALREESDSKSSEKIQCFCSIIHTCAQFEKELYKGSGEMQNKSC